MIEISKNLEMKVSGLIDLIDRNTKFRDKKIIYVLTDIVVSKYKNLKHIAKINYLTVPSLNELVLDRKAICRYLTDSEYLEFIDVYRELLKKHKDVSDNLCIKTIEEEKYDLTKNILDDVFNNYFNVTDICLKERIRSKKFSEITTDKHYIDLNFGNGTYEKFRKKLEENIVYCNRKPQKAIVIKSEKYLNIVNPNIVIVDEYDKKRLEAVRMYIDTNGNIEKIMEYFETDSKLPIITLLINSRTKELLNNETYYSLLPALNAERIIYSMDENVSVNDKKKLIDSVILSLRLNDYNVNLTSKELGLPLYLLKRILTDRMIPIFYGADVDSIQKCLTKKNENE